MPTEKHVGIVKRYYPKVHAASVELDTGSLEKGDKIQFRGSETELVERIHSMELDHEQISTAREGQEVGIEVPDPVEEGSEVLLVEDLYEQAEADLLSRVFES